MSVERLYVLCVCAHCNVFPASLYLLMLPADDVSPSRQNILKRKDICAMINRSIKHIYPGVHYIDLIYILCRVLLLSEFIATV